MTQQFENLQVGAVHVDGLFKAILTTPEGEVVWTSERDFPNVTHAYIEAAIENVNRDSFRSFMAEVWAR